MNKIIKLKHWQIFIILTIGIFSPTIIRETNMEIGNIDTMKLGVVLNILGLILFFSWIAIIGLFLNGISDNPHHFNKTIFLCAILCCIIGYSELNLSLIDSVNELIPWWISSILGLLTFFGLFYTFNNVPRSLKSLELNRQVMFKECWTDLILLLLYPIGVWIIQPKLNMFYEVNESIIHENEEVTTANPQ